MKTTQEGGGFIITCACLWLRFDWTRSGAEDVERAHGKKCKKASEPLVSRAFWGAPNERMSGTTKDAPAGALTPVGPGLTPTRRG